MLINSLGESWGIIFVLYKCTFGYAVVQVITCVFIQQTFKTASQDEEVMIKAKEKASELYLQRLDHLFDAIDESGDGILEWEEYSNIVSDPRIKAWFATLDIDSAELDKVFKLLD